MAFIEYNIWGVQKKKAEGTIDNRKERCPSYLDLQLLDRVDMQLMSVDRNFEWLN
jgi:hypothetical protein